MPRDAVKTIRLRDSDWALFEALKDRLQAEQTMGKISAREVFIFAVNSGTAALAAEKVQPSKEAA